MANKLLFTAILALTVSNVLSALPKLPTIPGLPVLALPSNYIITMKDTTDQVLANIANTKYATRADRLNAVTAALKEHAALTQGPLLNFLASQGNKIQAVESLWITNQVFVKGLVATLLDTILLYSGVGSILPEQTFNLNTPVFNLNPTSNAEWGIVKIQAPEASAIANGSQIRVGSIDTGVRSTHEALRDNFIGQYGWYDPYYGSSVPSDTVGHGTHTMGTLVGKEIGVAQGAKWMTCKGCDGNACSFAAMMVCGQFMLCPTLTDGSTSDCSQAPHLVSNSWGNGQGDTQFDPIIKAYHAAGIIPIFAAGNSGPTCNTIVSPADSQADVIAVGSTTNVDSVDPTSSHGPSFFQTVKPDVSAPGFLIRSAYNTSDTQYASGTGTSFACPHVAGAVAILLSANPSLTYADVKKHLIAGVDTTLLVPSLATNCGGKASTFPNNDFGAGRINVLKSVKSVLGQQ